MRAVAAFHPKQRVLILTNGNSSTQIGLHGLLHEHANEPGLRAKIRRIRKRSALRAETYEAGLISIQMLMEIVTRLIMHVYERNSVAKDAHCNLHKIVFTCIYSLGSLH